MKKKKVEDQSISNDYKSGITNLRFLAKKHSKTLKEVISYLKK